jgi:hypothetical protein
MAYWSRAETAYWGYTHPTQKLHIGAELKQSTVEWPTTQWQQSEKFLMIKGKG